MSDALYERYKDALRRGHVAAERSRTDAALEAYGEAARLAPDRALPLVGIGNVLARIGKADEALAAFDAALERAPTDEAALRRRADLLIDAGERAAAAATLDRLALTLERAGRHEAALDVAGRALELAESRSHRSGLRALIGRARTRATTDPGMAVALERAESMLEARVLTDEGRVAGSLDPAAASASDGRPPDTAPPDIAPPDIAPPDPVATMASAEDAAARHDPIATRDLAQSAAVGLRAAGQIDAALDVCYLALATNPADPVLHLTMAELYIDRGWDSLAADKLVLLARIIDLTDDAPNRIRLCAIVARHLAEEPRLQPICA